MQWRRDVAFAGYQVNIQMDISAEKMIFGVTDVDPQRRDELIKASSFPIDPAALTSSLVYQILHGKLTVIFSFDTMFKETESLHFKLVCFACFKYSILNVITFSNAQYVEMPSPMSM
jgi:hypothetical protein